MAKYDGLSREHFDQTASTYDSGCEGRMAARLYEAVLQKLKDGDCRSVLDVGCGTGTVLSHIAAMDKSIALYGVDLSPEMTRIAGERIGQTAGIRVCNICSDALPYDENSFDRVICMSAFHHFTDPEKVLGELHRVVKPEGAVLVADVTSFFPVRQFQNFYMSHFGKKGDVRFYSESEFRRLLEKCRFQSVKWERVPNIAPAYMGMLGFLATAVPRK